jgi:hypothetical protein
MRTAGAAATSCLHKLHHVVCCLAEELRVAAAQEVK